MTNKLAAVLAVATLFALAPSAEAVPIPVGPIVPVDLDLILPFAGVVVAGPLTTSFTTAAPPPPTIGTATNIVYFDSTTGIYTYTELVTPSINNVSEFNTGFAVSGFNGVAGYSFSQAAAAGTGFAINVDDTDFSMDWVALSQTAWDKTEGITFFFQSTIAPGSSLGAYNIINLETGTALSFAPAAVPEPSTLLLLGSGLLTLGVLRRSRR